MKEINIKILKDELRDLQEALNEQLETMISQEERLPQIEFDIMMENIRKMYDAMNKLYLLDAGDEKKKTIPESNKEQSPERSPERIIEAQSGEKNPVVTKKNEPQDASGTASLFSFEDLGFAQKLQEAREKSIGPRSLKKRPGDLKSMININDKFLFINDLFDGNLRDYSNAIENLNSLTQKQEAFDVLTQLLKQNLWNSQSVAFIKLRIIIEKGFE